MNRRALLLILPLTALFSFARPAQADKDEEEVSLEQVPPKVRETIEHHIQDGKLESIEKETKKGAIVYEAEYTKDGKECEIEIAEDGTLLSKEEEHGEGGEEVR